MNNVGLKFKESLISVLPISLIVLILGILVGIPSNLIASFIIGALMLIIGMATFSLGAEIAMSPIGTSIGSSFTKTKVLGIIILLCFVVGFIITIAEPDLMVLANQLSGAFNKYLIILTVSVGVGVFLVISMLRIFFQISLRKILIIFYSAIFILALFIPDEFLSIAFDSGGVTTGPMTVPIIIALGVGIAAAKSGNNIDDSFGLVGVCSIGPIISVLLLGLFSDTSKVSAAAFDVNMHIADGVFKPFIFALPHYMIEVVIALLPILIFFGIYNYIVLKLPKKSIKRIAFGLIYVYTGFVIFLTGVSVGFSPFGNLLAQNLVQQGYIFYLVPIGIVMGFFIVVAEPAVHILNDQIEEVSGGTIKKKSIMVSLMFGMSLAVGISFLRIIFGISLWWFILPGYMLSLLLTFFVPKVFTAIAFDSGGVASGPMTATFLLPFAVGATLAHGGNILTDAFGLIAIVAMTPLVTIQILGLIAVINRKLITPDASTLDESVIDLDNEQLSSYDIIDTYNDDEVIDFDDIEQNQSPKDNKQDNKQDNKIAEIKTNSEGK